MAQVIQNSYFKEQREVAREQKKPIARWCFSLREPTRKVCYIGSFVAALCIVFVTYNKAIKQCPYWSPYPLCVANKHCAYLKKNDLPFLQDGGRCVTRNDYQDYLYKGMESAVGFVSWLGSDLSSESAQTEETLLNRAKELIDPKKEGPQFKYYYDDEIFLRFTRYEIGLWLTFTILFLLRKVLATCGNKKSVFDFMRPSTSVPVRQAQQQSQAKPESLEEIRKLREEAMRKKKK